MNSCIIKIDKDQWRHYSKMVYESSFGDFRSKHIDRIDYALISSRGSEFIGFVTCKEMDSETVYWQFGGSFQEVENRVSIVPAYISLIDWCLEKYQRITTRIENTNIRMLHLAMKMGFIIVGTWNFAGKIFLELLNERGS